MLSFEVRFSILVLAVNHFILYCCSNLPVACTESFYRLPVVKLVLENLTMVCL